MNIYLAVISKIVDDQKFIIEFTIKDYIEARKAYPIDLTDKPNVQDAIVVYEIDSDIFGYSYLYQRLRISDKTTMSLLGNLIEVSKDNITISTSDGSNVNLNSDGQITINSNSSIEIKSASNINISGGTGVKISGSTVTPTGTGGFCAIKICPYTGAPHVGDTIV